MKKLSTLLVILLATFSIAIAQAPKSPSVKAESANVTVEYGQPSKRGRVIFAAEGTQSLEKYGKVWRTGANGCTKITFKKDGMFGGKAVKAGTYGLFTVPGEKEWTVILNSDSKQWGAYDYKADKDVLRVTVPAKANKEVVEAMTIKVSDTSLDYMWDMAGFSVPIKF
jgi:Protein of unknown function (DUF2911)